MRLAALLRAVAIGFRMALLSGEVETWQFQIAELDHDPFRMALLSGEVETCQ